MTHPPSALLTNLTFLPGSILKLDVNVLKSIALNYIANASQKEKLVIKVACAFAVEIQWEMKNK